MAERKRFKVIKSINPLSSRETEILELRANSLINKQIAQKLHISLNTVKSHISGISTEKSPHLGIFGKLERIYGKRPGISNWISPLIGDLLVEETTSNLITHGSTKLKPVNNSLE